MLFDCFAQSQIASAGGRYARQFRSIRSENVSEDSFNVVRVVKLPGFLCEFQFFGLRSRGFKSAALFRLRSPAVFAFAKLQRGLRYVLRPVKAAAGFLQQPFFDQRQNVGFALSDQLRAVSKADR